MYANHPEIAKRFEAETPKGKLPEHVKGKKKKRSMGHALNDHDADDNTKSAKMSVKKSMKAGGIARGGY